MNGGAIEDYAPSFRLDDRVALVTGAGQGLGRAIALALAGSGARTVAVGRREEPLWALADHAARHALDVSYAVADVTDLDSLAGLVDRVEAAVGEVDVLVNNAGTNVQQSAVDVDAATWDSIMDLNLRAPFFLSQELGRRWIADGRSGRIINIASQMAEVGFHFRSAYAASKAGLVAMSRVLAIEWARHGIRVNCVGPTFTDSPLAQHVLADPAFRTEVLSRIPIGRLGTPEEVAAAVVYLASDPADLVTGHHLLTDGGWTAM
ncbi:2-deoxy-D-gluconate 3-dehydrogenase [Microbacterium sp. SLBN-154]|uniref:SDR family NAD(P)-dependent oxidoreductase n=1 Tax=Microbacterium sp. SLBN-154 TaxID=2768458 RepID=UPI00114E02DC|nr:SDR family oxidoreductase [Microbacterium sp. SLBN-154]TQK17655.1 2-deoxy-D-gluconate 3-dehydrogenase [Microbacterium sp. SLBN-154]